MILKTQKIVSGMNGRKNSGRGGGGGVEVEEDEK